MVKMCLIYIPKNSLSPRDPLYLSYEQFSLLNHLNPTTTTTTTTTKNFI